jgi:putative peptidoglycan lipid II flippase
MALIFLAPGLIAFSTVNILARAFFATGDTVTPMKTSVFCLAVNIIITILLIKPLQQKGMALANTMTAFLNVYLLSFALKKKLKQNGLERILPYIIKTLIIGIISGVAAWLVFKLWEGKIGHANIWQRLGEVFIPISISVALYFALALLLKIGSANEIVRLVSNKLPRRKTY